MACLAGDGWLKTGADAPAGPKALLNSLPRGSYTACRTVGGVRGQRIVLLEYNLDRLCNSIRIIHPTLPFDGLAACESEAATASHEQRGLVDVPKGANDLLVLYGGDDARGASAAEQLARQLQERVEGARVQSVKGSTPDMLQGCSSCALILECDGDGQPVFAAAKFLRALKKDDAPPLSGLNFSVLGLTGSACAFSSASLGKDKFRGASALDARLEALGGTRIAAFASSDVEVEDLKESVLPWMQGFCDALLGTPRSYRKFDVWVRRVAAERMAAALGGMTSKDEDEEAMLIVVCHPDVHEDGTLKGVGIQAFASSLHEALDPAVVQVGARPRSLPLAKDTAWVNERIPFEEEKGPGVSEVLILDEDGHHILEGLITNFFVLDKEGTLVTSPDKVLKGHMRQLLLSVARRHRIKIRLEAPDVREAHTWKGCFLTSATRVVQPIKTIRIPGKDATQPAEERHFEDLSDVAALRERVLAVLLA